MLHARIKKASKSVHKRLCRAAAKMLLKAPVTERERRREETLFVVPEGLLCVPLRALPNGEFIYLQYVLYSDGEELKNGGMEEAWKKCEISQGLNLRTIDDLSTLAPTLLRLSKENKGQKCSRSGFLCVRKYLTEC